MKKEDIWLIFLFLILAGTVFLSFYKKLPYRLGLDVSGGTVLTYQADLASIKKDESKDVMEGVKDLIERRVNFLGIAETSINYTNSGRVIVEIPNIKDPAAAIKIIGETPLLEFRIPQEVPVYNMATGSASKVASASTTIEFIPTRLTGRFLKRAQLAFDQNALEPYVSLEFDKEGAKLFETLTKAYVGKEIAIYLDGTLVSAPVVREVISGGQAQISGRFTLDEAKTLSQRLNQGALPVPLTLISQTVINPTLGEKFLDLAVKGGVYGGVLVILFMLLYYRGLGLVANIALIFYLFFNLALYKIMGVVLSLSGIAGLILSVGMAVDANILVFERTREELKRGYRRTEDKPKQIKQDARPSKSGRSPFESTIKSALDAGFKRAWTSIRDSNITTIISAIVIYFSTTSFVKGFALTLGLGVLVSMLTAYFLSRILIVKFSPLFERWQKLL